MIIERVTGTSYAAAVRRDLLPGLGKRIAVQTAEPPVAPGSRTQPHRDHHQGDGQFLPNRAWATVDLTTLVYPGYGLGTEILEQRWAPAAE